MISPETLHYLAAGLSILLGALGAGIGQGIAASSILETMLRQPSCFQSIFRSMLIGLALIESGCIIALVVSILIFLNKVPEMTLGVGIAEISAGLLVGIAAMTISIASSFVVRAAGESIARQPFFASKITTLMLLSQTIIEAPAIFSFVIAIIIITSIKSGIPTHEGIKCLAASIALAIGSIGPSIGQALCASSSCKSAGLNTDAYNKILPFNIINQAVIETPVIFCLLTSFLILFTPIPLGQEFLKSSTLLAASFAISLGTLGTASGMGIVASKGSHYIAKNINIYPLMLKTTLLALAFIESSIIYALIIALLIIMR